MAQIKIDYDGLQQQSAAMRNCIQNYESLISRTNAVVSQIQDSWQGESSVAYVETVSKYIQQANLLTGILERIRSTSDIVTNRFSEVDNKCAQMINSSF